MAEVVDRSYVRLGALAAVVGGVLALVGNVLHPRYDPDLTDEEMLRKVADSGIWQVDHLMLVVGLILSILGVVTIARTMRGGVADGLARHGRTAVYVGGSVALVSIGMDAFTTREVAERYVAAGPADQATWLNIALGVGDVGTAVFATWVAVLLGVSSVLLGLAAIQSGRYPAWTGWLAVLGGAGSFVVGMAMLGGADADDMTIPFLVTSLMVTAWIIGAGWHLLRTVEAVGDAPTPSRTAVSA